MNSLQPVARLWFVTNSVPHVRLAPMDPDPAVGPTTLVVQHCAMFPLSVAWKRCADRPRKPAIFRLDSFLVVWLPMLHVGPHRREEA